MLNPEQLFNAEIKKRLAEESFPCNLLPNGFLLTAATALRHESKANLGCDAETFASILNLCIERPLADKISVYQMGFLINCVDSKSAIQLAVTTQEYIRIVLYLEQLQAAWNEIVTPIKKSIIRKIEAMEKLNASSPSNKQLVGKA